MNKKRLLIATDTYYPKKDGVVRFLNNVIPSLTRKYEITLLVPKFEENVKKIRNTKIIFLDTYKRFNLADYPSIRLNLKNLISIKKAVKESDIIFTQDIAPIGAMAIKYGKKYKKPVLNYLHQITWEHFADVFSKHKIIKKFASFFIKRYSKHFYNKCSLILIPYKELNEEFKKQGITTNRAIIKLGVRFDKYIPSENKRESKKKIGIREDMFVIGYCGRISKEKDLGTLKRAFLRLKEKYKNVYLLIIGGGTKEETERFKHNKDIRVTGFVRNVVHYLQAIDVFVMPSLTETTSLATIEAMAVGLPVISTKVGYIKDYLKDKINGMFFPKQNDYILRTKIEILMSKKSSRKELGANARQTVINNFNWNNTIENIKKALDMF